MFRLSGVYLLGITLISASALAYQVLLLRLFSIIQWHHFAFMIISLALLGYGVSGVFLALTRDYVSRHFPSVIMTNLLLLALSMPLCFMVAQELPFNPSELLWDPWQLFYWLAVYLVLAVPFFFAANIIGLSFYQFRTGITTLYAADLLGAALGSIGIIVLLFAFLVEQILVILPCLVLFAGLLLVSLAWEHSGTKKLSWQALMIGVAAMMLVLVPASLQLQMSPYKSQSQLMTIPQTEVVKTYSSPLGVLNVVESKAVPLRYAPGLSISSEANLPEQLAVFSDGDAMTAINRFDGNPLTLQYLRQTTSALPYQFGAMDDVLVLGAGAGSDVLQALLFSATRIDAVEQNPQMIRLLKNDYAEFAGELYSLPQVSVHQSEARSFITRTENQYDLITMSMIDGSGMSSGGLYSMTENYLYTVEAMQQYLQHLKPDGYLSLTRRATLPPRDMPKLVATLKQLPQETVSQSLLLIRSWQTSTLLIKNGVVTDDEISRLKHFSEQNNFDLAYYPGIKSGEVNRFHKLSQPYLYQAASALAGSEGDKFIEDYKFNLRPATDDQPYFSQFFRWQTLPEILSLLDQGSVFLLESGYLLLLAALVQALVASALLLLLPLWLWQRRQGRREANPLHKKVLGYFFVLGLAFLFVEIAFIQKFILILHHPVYAVTTVIASFLLAAGLGSYVSGKLPHIEPQIRVIGVVIGITLLSLVYLLAFGPISAFLLQQNDVLRYMLAVVLIMPIGFCMGAPFPTGLAVLSREHADLIPWAWGINGFASVMSPIVATLIAMQFGFRVLIFVAVLLYLLAAWLFPGAGKINRDSN